MRTFALIAQIILFVKTFTTSESRIIANRDQVLVPNANHPKAQHSAHGTEKRKLEFSPFFASNFGPIYTEDIETTAQRISENAPFTGQPDIPIDFKFPKHLFTYNDKERGVTQDDFSTNDYDLSETFSIDGPLFREDLWPVNHQQQFIDSITSENRFKEPLDHAETLEQFIDPNISENLSLTEREEPLIASSSNIVPLSILPVFKPLGSEVGRLGIPAKEQRFLDWFQPLI